MTDTLLSADFVASAWPALALTLRLAAATTVLLLALGTPLAWWLARSNSRWREPISALVTLPLVLPPSVLGFYVLVALGPHGPLGQLTQWLGWGTLSFTFTGLVLGSIVYSLPFAVQPLQAAFAEMGPRPMEVAMTLGAKPLNAFLTVALPQARHGLITAAVLSFAHTLGEFGVVLMVGGNIPGETRTLSIALYDKVQGMELQSAHVMALALVALSVLALALVLAFDRAGVRGRALQER